MVGRVKAITEEALDRVHKLVTVEHTGHSLRIQPRALWAQCDSGMDQLGPGFVTRKWQQVREVPGGWLLPLSVVCGGTRYVNGAEAASELPRLVNKMSRGRPQQPAPLSGIILK